MVIIIRWIIKIYPKVLIYTKGFLPEFECNHIIEQAKPLLTNTLIR